MSRARNAAPLPLAPPIDADRRLRGPYTAAGAIAGALVPVAMKYWPELVAQYDIELRTVAPDLGIPARRESLAARIPRAERILVPAAQRTLRIANGFTDFVAEHLVNLASRQSDISAGTGQYGTSADTSQNGIADNGTSPHDGSAVRDPGQYDRETAGSRLEETAMRHRQNHGNHTGATARSSRTDSNAATAQHGQGGQAPRPSGHTTRMEQTTHRHGPHRANQETAVRNGNCGDRSPERTLRTELPKQSVTPSFCLTIYHLEQADPADRELLNVLERRLGKDLLVIETTETAGTVGSGQQDTGPSGPSEGEIGPRLGEALFRLEDGSDVEAAEEAFRFAVEWCLENGCHHAVIEVGTRGLKVARPDDECWWRLVHSVAMAMAALHREAEAEELLMRARAMTASPVWHSTINYTVAMLYTRHHDPAARDLDKALGWVNSAIAICELLPDPANRAVKLGFDLNGKALIEARRGNPAGAMRLVQRAIDLADRDLEPDAQPIHRLVLKANRAQLRMRLGALDAALADLDAVIAADPGYPDYYLDRGNLLHRLGRDDDALADYATALAVGPPFPEPHFNRAEIHFARGDHERALADLDRALDLDPDFLDARINRAGLLVELEEYAQARADVEAGLVLDPTNAHLHCALGQIAMAEGHHDRARKAFDTALRTAPELAEAWASRGMLAFEQGNCAEAVGDLTAALRLGETAALRYNRAIALRAAGQPERADADLKRALELAPDDEDIQRELTAHA